MSAATPPEFCTILPCNDLNASERFYNELGFRRTDEHWLATREPRNCRTLANGKGGYLRLTYADEGRLVQGKNPFGLYLYLEDVDAIARRFQKSPKDEPWGMYEFAMLDPDQLLVRVGWPSRLRHHYPHRADSCAADGSRVASEPDLSAVEFSNV